MQRPGRFNIQRADLHRPDCSRGGPRAPTPVLLTREVFRGGPPFGCAAAFILADGPGGARRGQVRGITPRRRLLPVEMMDEPRAGSGENIRFFEGPGRRVNVQTNVGDVRQPG